VLITGASKGIGAGLAEAFAAEGAALHLVARNDEGLRAVREIVVDRYDVTVETTLVDLTSGDDRRRLTEACGEVDILVNNAGSIPGGPLDAIDEESWRTGWELKVMGYIDMTRLLYGRMKARGSGVIVNNIGNAGEIFDARYIAGATGNASLMAFTRALGGVSLDDGVRVVGVNPGPVETERIIKLLKRRAVDLFGDENRWQDLRQRYPLARPALVSEVADVIVFLASERCNYVSGTIWTVDGGIASRGSII
jgi:NAD(P)-dependent dehydrogenase (short-subunit alcohol dehydrogenase family)